MIHCALLLSGSFGARLCTVARTPLHDPPAFWLHAKLFGECSYAYFHVKYFLGRFCSSIVWRSSLPLAELSDLLILQSASTPIARWTGFQHIYFLN